MIVPIGIVLAVLVGAMAGWWWFVKCERLCADADRQAQALFRRGDLLASLALIDAVDSRCRCSRFTSGDAPALYALAGTCIKQLREQGRDAELASELARARGPIITELALPKSTGTATR